jgi:hypothetical protein
MKPAFGVTVPLAKSISPNVPCAAAMVSPAAPPFDATISRSASESNFVGSAAPITTCPAAVTTATVVEPAPIESDCAEWSYDTNPAFCPCFVVSRAKNRLPVLAAVLTTVMPVSAAVLITNVFATAL